MKNISLILILFLTVNSFGQIKFVGLSSNPELQHKSQIVSKRNITINDTLSLPFIEDFAYNYIYPIKNLWLDNNVFINNNFADNPPSVGVATFDILDPQGLMYSTAATSSFLSDVLTSRPINLSSFNANDSIYMSFFYQPQGKGWDSPDSKDSLVLQFYDNENSWHTVWSQTGSSLHAFKQVMLPVIDSLYFVNNFQFRFYNYASIGSLENQEDAITNDFWNLDFIVIDTARSVLDTNHEDISFKSFNNSLFQYYYSVPWSHFNYNSMQKDSVKFTLQNNGSSSQVFNLFKIKILENETNIIDTLNFGSTNISPNSNITFSNTLVKIDALDHNVGIHIPNELEDSTRFNFSMSFEPDIAQADSSYKINDKVSFTQNFYNYYAYDDGTAELGLALIEAGNKFAFRIDPLRGDTIRGLSMFFNRYKDYQTADPSLLTLCVWENNNGVPGDTLYTQENISPQYGNAINRFSTYKFDKSFWIDDTIFVGFINQSNKGYSVGYDDNNSNNNQVFVRSGGNWQHISRGVPMIRAIFGDDFVPISVPEIDYLKHLSIYPNPSNNQINIETGTDKTLNLKVFNSTGKTLINKNITQRDLIHLKKFGSGLYIIRIQDRDHSIHKKIIIL